jgi:hypothetical protein
MKKKILKFTLDALLLAGILYACRQDFDELIVNRPWSVNDARAWYEAHKPDYIQLKSGSNEKRIKYIKPDWSRSIISKNDREEVVETDIKTNGGFGFATQENYDVWKLTGNDNYLRTHTRLVVVRNKGAKTEEGFFMTIAGDKKYKEKHDFDMSENTYLKKGNDFSGLILFHHLDGSFSNGWKYTDGKLTHTAKIEMGEKIEFQLKSTAPCQTENSYFWYIDCTDYYYVVSYYHNGTLYSSDWNYNYSTCESIFAYLGSMTTCSSSSPAGGGYNTDSNSTNTSQSNTPTADKIVSNYNTLYLDQKKAFERNLNELIQTCGFKAIYDYLTDHGFKIGVKMNGNLNTSAAYEPLKNTLQFKDNSSFENPSATKEELIHAFQDSYYSGGIDKYVRYGQSTPGFCNIEFESKVITDLITPGCCSVFSNNLEVQDKYIEWTSKIKNDNFKVDPIEYAGWLKTFKENHPEYNSPESAELKRPNALNSVSGKFCQQN